MKKHSQKPQATRLLKVECLDCGYVCRVTQKWLDAVGAPICPCNMKPMIAPNHDKKAVVSPKRVLVPVRQLEHWLEAARPEG